MLSRFTAVAREGDRGVERIGDLAVDATDTASRSRSRSLRVTQFRRFPEPKLLSPGAHLIGPPRDNATLRDSGEAF